MIRPSIHTVKQALATLLPKAITYSVPVGRDKGKVGKHLEKILGIPTSSAALDCVDGEVKCIPLMVAGPRTRRGSAGDLLPKESCAVTMLNPTALATHSFDTSKVRLKLANTLFVFYLRDGDTIRYVKVTHLTHSTHPSFFQQLELDYDSIRTHYTDTGKLPSARVGKYLQNRTKGPGGDAKKTRAFYLRTQAIHDI